MHKFLMFDVESTSLHGVGFAWGAVVMDTEGNKIDTKILVSEECPNPNDWVKENVIPNLKWESKVKTLIQLRNEFWEFLQKWQGIPIWGDCVFPVETNFLSEVAKGDLANREYKMPYPLKDLATHLDVEISRCEFGDYHVEENQHNPLHDAIASARALVKYHTIYYSSMDI